MLKEYPLNRVFTPIEPGPVLLGATAVLLEGCKSLC